MINKEASEELIATAMAGYDIDGTPLYITIRVLTDGTENAIEVSSKYLENNEPIDLFYIPADGGLVAMITSMSSMLPIQTTDPTALPVNTNG